MPELPEVEIIVRQLKKHITGKKIIKVKIREAMVIAYPKDEAEFKKGLAGRKIIDVLRRGKYILITLNQGKKLIFHLRMSGRLLIKDSYEEYNKHTHIIFKLENDKDL